MLRHHRDGPQGASQCQRAHVTHKDLCRVGIEPQEPQAGPEQRPTEYRQFTRPPYMHEVQIVSKIGVADNIDDAGIDEGGNDKWPSRKAIQTYGMVRFAHRRVASAIVAIMSSPPMVGVPALL